MADHTTRQAWENFVQNIWLFAVSPAGRWKGGKKLHQRPVLHCPSVQMLCWNFVLQYSSTAQLTTASDSPLYLGDGCFDSHGMYPCHGRVSPLGAACVGNKAELCILISLTRHHRRIQPRHLDSFSELFTLLCASEAVYCRMHTHACYAGGHTSEERCLLKTDP